MHIFRRAAGFLIHRSGKQNLVSLLLWALCFAISPQSLLASQDQDVPPVQQDVHRGPGSYRSWLRPLRSIRIRLCRRFWTDRRNRFRNGSRSTIPTTRACACPTKPSTAAYSSRPVEC